MTDGAARGDRRAALLGWIGAGLSIGLLAIALAGADLRALGASLVRADWRLVPPFLAALFLFYWIKTLRWSALLSPARRIGTRELFGPIMVGYAASALLPMQLGEVARSYIVARRFRVAGLAVFVSVALERILDLLSILVWLGIALAFSAAVPPSVATAGMVLAAAAIAGLLLLIGYLRFTEGFVSVARWLARPLPQGAAERILGQLERGAIGAAALRSPSLLARVLLTSVLQWLGMMACVALSLQAFGIQATIGATLVVMVFMVIGTSLPNSPGFVGSIQLAYVLALRPFGVSTESAIAASVYFHVLAYLSVVVVGLYCLRGMGVSWRELRGAGEPRQNGTSVE